MNDVQLGEFIKRFQEIESRACQSATMFNRIVRNGKTIEEYTDEELLDALTTQVNHVAMEEVCEWLNNFGVDKTEELDGYADVLYTVPYMAKLLDEVCARLGHDQTMINFVGHKLALKMHLIYQVYDTMTAPNFIPKDKDGSGLKTLDEAVRRVCMNNSDKFTTDALEFLLWDDPDGERLNNARFECDNQTYFAFVNESGKVRKRKGFPTVDLSDLIDDFE